MAEMRGIDGRQPELPEQFRHGLTRRPPSHKLQPFIHNRTSFHGPLPPLSSF